MPRAKQQNKYDRWCLTVQSVNRSGLPRPNELRDCLEQIASKYVFQLEVGEKKKKHYQCAFSTKERTRQATLLRKMSGILNRDPAQFQVERQYGTWDEAVSYCIKLKERVGDEFYSNFKIYDESDLKMILEKESRRPFQQSIIEMVLNSDENDFIIPHDRTIYWIHDQTGGSGKSRIVKWFMRKFPRRVASFSCNTDSQLRCAAIDAQCRDLVFVDIPRAQRYQANHDEKIANILSALEDIKNGCVSSSMYGRYRTMLCAPCHVFVFSNNAAPSHMLTKDRWCECVLTENYELKAKTESLNNFFIGRPQDLISQI